MEAFEQEIDTKSRLYTNGKQTREREKKGQGMERHGALIKPGKKLAAYQLLPSVLLPCSSARR